MRLMPKEVISWAFFALWRPCCQALSATISFRRWMVNGPPFYHAGATQSAFAISASHSPIHRHIHTHTAGCVNHARGNQPAPQVFYSRTTWLIARNNPRSYQQPSVCLSRYFCPMKDCCWESWWFHLAKPTGGTTFIHCKINAVIQFMCFWIWLSLIYLYLSGASGE